MIVLDEQLEDRHFRDAIAKWYKGSVILINALRPESVIKDDGIASLLVAAKSPTFVTINVSDFWRKIDAHHSYCIVMIDLKQDDADDLPQLLRSILQMSQFSTKAKRMGNVIRLKAGRIRYYTSSNPQPILLN